MAVQSAQSRQNSHICFSATNGNVRKIPNDRAPLDYVALFRADPANTFFKNVPQVDQTGDGALRRGVNCRLAEISDGTSNTLLLVEDAGRNQVWIRNRYYPMWLAGAGVKPGFSYGSSDEFGLHAVEGKMHMMDLHVRGRIAKIPHTRRWKVTPLAHRMLGTCLQLYYHGLATAA